MHERGSATSAPGQPLASWAGQRTLQQPWRGIDGVPSIHIFHPFNLFRLSVSKVAYCSWGRRRIMASLGQNLIRLPICACAGPINLYASDIPAKLHF